MPTQNASISALRKGLLPLILWACLLGVQGFDVPMLSQKNMVASATVTEVHDAAQARPKRVAIRPKQKVTPDAAGALLPVVVQKDVRLEHQILADQVLRALPSYCRNNLKNFYVNYEPKPASRGLGGASTMIITGNVPAIEFGALIVHECGHVADLGGIKGTKESGVSAFIDGSTPIYNNDPSVAFYSLSWKDANTRKLNTTEADFVSGYSTADAFEDAAETFAFFALQKEEFARLAKSNAILKAKYDYMDQVVFKNQPSIATGKYVRSTTRAPWDVTLLPYEWHAKQ